MSVKWMQIHIAKFNVEKVEKYDYLDKYAYLFKGGSLNNVLFTCQGMELCNYREVEQSECSAKVVNLGKATTIWEKTK